jgi:TrmH family RNA methyltransferase
VGEARDASADFVHLIWCDALLTSDFGRSLVSAATCPVSEISADLFRAISERDNPTGLAAILRRRTRPLADCVPAPDSVLIALWQVADPGNLGTIIRTVDAAGGHGVILVGATVDATHPTALKASMGAFFAVPVWHAPDLAALTGWARQHRLHVVATSARGSADFRHVPYPHPLLLLLGSEREGLPAEGVESADATVAIPMRGVATSLNLAVAAGLLLYQAAGEG